ncbi:glycosyltransferase [Corynebacterium fournieri]|uniref:glycosyltransferase n=1 Tax=Corynebacterium fournieri TaxID=1852390 RepID=UPI000A2F49B8|nr:glycosyltransferase [Corynebacterium fournieri]WJY96626.1 UDP-Gal:alpha-D-GlcNAc-diphosphoundecaprenol beta-1,3-galactosyltransferase [Corynebacterium fournieri]
MATITALVTVYHGTDADDLARALDSLRAQTRPADELVIVADGPVSEAVRRVVDKQKARVLWLPENLGAGPASQAGLTTIDSDYTARLDSDDAAKPERFARQLEYLEAHPDVGALGTAVEEFAREPGDTGNVRALPENPHTYAKMNSPVNNPSVMLRTRAVKEVGGYHDVHFMEDYDLYARLIAGGWQVRNLQEALTDFQVTDAQFSRRTGRDMFAAEAQMQRNLVAYGLIGRPRAVFNLAARSAYRALPTGLLRRVYAALFHRGE